MTHLPWRRGLPLFGFAMALAATAQASVLYQQPSLNAVEDLGAFQYFGQELADDFILGSAATVRSIAWKGGYHFTENVSGSESFTVHIHVGRGVPSLVPFYAFIGMASVTPTLDTRDGKTVYDYFLDVADVGLNAGVLYWISIYSNANPANYAWSPSAEGSPVSVLRRSGGTWARRDGQDDRVNQVFVLNDTDAAAVVEPATFGILGLALAGLGLTRQTRPAG